MACKALSRKLRETAGQATVEYAIVLAGFLLVVVGLGALAGLFREGTVADHALFSASHNGAGEAVGVVLEVFSF